MLDLIIKGGTVVAPEGASVMDVGIEGEKIVANAFRFAIVKIAGQGDAQRRRDFDVGGSDAENGGIGKRVVHGGAP